MLKKLYFDGCELTDDVCEIIASGLNDHEETVQVTLCANPELGDRGVIALVRQTPQLTCLRLRFNRKVSDRTLEFICQNCLELDELDLEETGITSRGLDFLLGNLKKVETLRISPSLYIEENVLLHMIEDGELLKNEYIGDLMYRLCEGKESSGGRMEVKNENEDAEFVSFGIESKKKKESSAKRADIMKLVREEGMRDIDEDAFLQGQVFYGTKTDVSSRLIE